ncbi:MAG: conjugal transfer protein TraX, partial [Lachnospiraceae bacterium]|nr:conjugal transfer protein TraX [Lachnospiraceae bacterium]
MKTRGLCGSTLKIIAIISMVFDHIGRIVIENGLIMKSPRGALSDETFSIIEKSADICGILGRVAFPIFCFLLVEGFLHTRSVLSYGRNLALFAIFTEPIYDYAFTGKLIDFSQQNVMFELLLGLLVLVFIDTLGKKFPIKNKVCFKLAEVCLSIIGLFAGLLSQKLFLDGGLYGIAMIIAFYLLRDMKVLKVIVGILIVLFFDCYLIGGGFDFSLSNVLQLESFSGILSMILIYFYNGKRGLRMKYFFYGFYPVHLLLLSFLS